MEFIFNFKISYRGMHPHRFHGLFNGLNNNITTPPLSPKPTLPNIASANPKTLSANMADIKPGPLNNLPQIVKEAVSDETSSISHQTALVLHPSQDNF